MHSQREVRFVIAILSLLHRLGSLAQTPAFGLAVVTARIAPPAPHGRRMVR